MEFPCFARICDQSIGWVWSRYGEGGGGLAYEFHWFFFGWVFPWDTTFILRIWHECDSWKRDLAQPCLWSGGMWKSYTWMHFDYGNKSPFSLVLMGNYACYSMDFMVFMCYLFMLLICWLWLSFMMLMMYGSHHVLIRN